MYLVKSPLLLKWYYPNLVWSKSRSSKTVYLTFDDGPIPIVTEFVLNTLRDYHAKATFFCIGNNIVKHPDIFNKVKNDRHRIGNHTYNHLKGWKTDDETYLKNVLKCQKLTKTNLFRPPYGRIKKSQVSNLKSRIPNLEIIMWDCLSGDFDVNLSPHKCYLNVVNNIRNGSIIVFHDSLKALERLEYTLPKVLEKLSKEGYEFGLL